MTENQILQYMSLYDAIMIFKSKNKIYEIMFPLFNTLIISAYDFLNGAATQLNSIISMFGGQQVNASLLKNAIKKIPEVEQSILLKNLEDSLETPKDFADHFVLTIVLDKLYNLAKKIRIPVKNEPYNFNEIFPALIKMNTLVTVDKESIIK